MIEADIKKFLNGRTPSDPLFKALDVKIDDVLTEFRDNEERTLYNRRVQMFNNAAEYVATQTTSSKKYFTAFDGNNNLGQNIFGTSQYSRYSYDGMADRFKLKISDNMSTFAYLYSDIGSTTYTQWRLGGAYNPTFFVASRAALTFSGLPTDVSWTAMDMSADGEIICVSSATTGNYLYVLKRNVGSNIAYSVVQIDVQPTAATTNMVISGDGRTILRLQTASPFLTVYKANADRTAYAQQNLAAMGITVYQYATLAAASFDGATIALGYSYSSARKIDIFRILSGNTYSAAGVSDTATTATIGADYLITSTQRDMQLSRDGNILLVYMYRNGYNTTYYPYILKFDNSLQSFAFNQSLHGNQLWRADATSTYGVRINTDNRQWLMSADGNWLFCGLFNRITGSSGSVSTYLYVSDISGQQVQKQIPIHVNSLLNSNPDSSSTNAQLAAQNYFWIDPNLRYVWRGTYPAQAAVTGVSNTYVYNLIGYNSGDIVVIDPKMNWSS